MIKELKGIVEAYPEGSSGDYPGPLIDGKNIAKELSEFDGKTVWVGFMDETFTGRMEIWGGFYGWSEWTPTEYTEFYVDRKSGDYSWESNIANRISSFDEEEVTLIVSDEGPINPADYSEIERG